MNKTTEAKYDLATRMLKVDISVDEVALMSGLTIDEIEKLKAGIEPEEIIDEAAFAEKQNPIDVSLFHNHHKKESDSMKIKSLSFYMILLILVRTVSDRSLRN